MSLSEIGKYIFSLTSPDYKNDKKPYGSRSMEAPTVEKKTKSGFILECSYGCPVSILSTEGRRYLFNACSPIDKRWNSVMNDLIKNLDLRIMNKTEFGNSYEIRKFKGKTLPPVKY